jgi:putative DNA primase/helicase
MTAFAGEAGQLTLADLATQPTWVAWQQENGESGEPTKMPYVAIGVKAKANAESWITRSAAETLAAQLKKPFGMGGVGIQFVPLGDGRSTFGVDLDTCRNAETGKLTNWAENMFAKLQTYAEVSPSKTGIKFYGTYDTGALPELRKHMGNASWSKVFKQRGEGHPPAIELHLGHRYFAVTDEILAGSRADLRHIEVETILQLLKVDGPVFVGNNPANTAERNGGRDQSKSAAAFRKAAELVKSGCDFAAMVKGLEVDPDTAEWTRKKGHADGSRELKRIFEKIQAGMKVDGFDVNEDGIALAFTQRHCRHLRYCHHTGAWFRYDETCWSKDEKKLAFSWARQVCRTHASNAPDNKKATLAKAATAAAVERFAQADQTLAVTSEVWDRDLFLLGTPGGTIDLRTGQLRQQTPDDYITKLTAVTPASKPDCPLWLTFLAQVTGDNAGLIRFLRQWCGYCLTGDISEQSLVFAYGPGGNGKGVLLSTLADIMGDYACNAAMDTFTASANDRHSTDLAMLRGARLVTASETEEGHAWAEGRIKSLTGGDKITARFMRQDNFEYLPQFKLFIIGNHQPTLREVSEAMKRRINMVPFLFKPEKVDLKLGKKLKAEWPGILRWMIDGCLDWQANGLVRPTVLTDATAEYFYEQDMTARWLEERCNLGAQKADTQAALFKSWTDYALANGEKPGTSKMFSQSLSRQPGCKSVKHTPGKNGERGFMGIELKRVVAGQTSEPDENPRTEDRS